MYVSYDSRARLSDARCSPHLRSRGMGLSPGAQTAESISLAGASTTLGILAAMHAVIGGVAMAGPVGAAIAGILAIAPLIVNLFKGCGQTCIAATKIANQAATVLGQNFQAYSSSPTRTVSMQAAALNNVKTIFAALQQGCSDPALGAAGQRCISERLVRGGTAPWCPNPGHTGCDWYALYYDPIANDPGVVPDPVPVAPSAASVGTSLLSAVGLSPSTTVAGVPLSSLALPAGLLFAAWFMFGRD